MQGGGGVTKVSLFFKIPLKLIDFNFEKTSEISENRRISFSPFSQDLKTPKIPWCYYIHTGKNAEKILSISQKNLIFFSKWEFFTQIC